MIEDNKKVNGKNYWRSLNQLQNNEDFQKFVENEFPEGTLEVAKGMNRRKFLSLMGASMALAGLAGCRRPVEKIIPYSAAPEEIVPGVANYYATSIPYRLNAHGLIVESHEGRPTKIEGNPDHPLTGGSSNSYIQAEILNLYDPDRSQHVRHHSSRSTWEEFLLNWAALRKKYLENGGEGLAVLSESFASPTLAGLKNNFTELFPKAQWVAYEPLSDENIYRGLELATGQLLQPVYHFEKSKVVLSLDADFQLGDSNDISNTRGFANSRRVKDEHGTMSRLYAVESGFSITGAMADHKLSVKSGDIATFALALIQELSDQGVSVPVVSSDQADVRAGFDSKWLSVLAEDLKANKERGIVLAGPGQPAEVHALVYGINAALRNNDNIIRYYKPEASLLPITKALTDLAENIKAGKVTTMAVIGGNPVYNAPADLKFGQLIDQVETFISFSSHVDETASSAHWHIPRAHFLESWGDVRSFDGTMGIIQPMIEPLFKSVSDAAFFYAFTNGESKKDYDIVRDKWREILDSGNFDELWENILHDGIYRKSSYKPINAGVRETGLKKAVKNLSVDKADKFEIVFRASSSVYDGRYSNNGWLQENPDPITKLTWDNAAVMCPATAKHLGVKSENIVEVRSSKTGQAINLPVWIVPGFAEYSISVALGYGRKIGRVATGTGANSYLIRNSQEINFSEQYNVQKTSGKYMLASTQDHSGLDTEKLAADAIEKRLPVLIREATLDEYRHEPEFAKELVEVPHTNSLWKEHNYEKGNQWGMAVDLNVCNGCNACTIACQSENNIPVVGKDEVEKGREMHWIRIDRYFAGDYENPEMVFQPVGCQHCELAPCEQVCPVAATVHDEEGLNTMVYNRCIGTRYCANNCPYKVRRFNFFNYTKEMPEIVQMAMNPDVTVRFRGVMEKCTYCTQRINQTKLDAKNNNREYRDGDMQTACQQTCPTDAIAFGDLNDPESAVSQVKKQNRDYDLLSEMNFKPRTTYQAKLRNPNPKLI